MKNLDLKIYPDPCLLIKTSPVDSFSPKITEIINSMADVMSFSRTWLSDRTYVSLNHMLPYQQFFVVLFLSELRFEIYIIPS